MQQLQSSLRGVSRFPAKPTQRVPLPTACAKKQSPGFQQFPSNAAFDVFRRQQPVQQSSLRVSSSFPAKPPSTCSAADSQCSKAVSVSSSFPAKPPSTCSAINSQCSKAVSVSSSFPAKPPSTCFATNSQCSKAVSEFQAASQQSRLRRVPPPTASAAKQSPSFKQLPSKAAFDVFCHQQPVQQGSLRVSSSFPVKPPSTCSAANSQCSKAVSEFQAAPQQSRLRRVPPPTASAAKQSPGFQQFPSKAAFDVFRRQQPM